MALKLTAILLLVIFVTLQFGGRDLENGPFAETPGVNPTDVILTVAPLDEIPALPVPTRVAVPAPQPAALPTVKVETVSAPATPAEPPENAAVDAQAALDLAVIDADAINSLRDSTGPDAIEPVAPSLSLLPDTAVTPEPVEVPAPKDMAEVTGSSVNLRAGPSTGNAVLGRAARGDRVEWVSSPEQGWAMIRHPDIEGEVYMSSTYLRRIEN